MSKERVTVLACSNANRTHKLPLMVTAKSKKPRSFKNYNMNPLLIFTGIIKKSVRRMV